MDFLKGALPENLTDISFGAKPSEIRVAFGSSGKRRVETVTDFLPYFYLKGPPPARPEKVDGIIRLEDVERTISGRKETLLKVFADSPARVPELREKLPGKTFEAEIPFLRRFMIDNGLKPFSSGQPTILVFDIEVLAQLPGMPDPKKDEIILISYCFLRDGKPAESAVLSSKGSQMVPDYVRRLESEGELIEEFFSTVRRLDPDIVAGYNSDNFDFPYVSQRAKKNGIEAKLGIDGSELSFRKRGRLGGTIPEIFGRQVIDIYLFVRYIISHDPTFRSKTLDLDAVGQEIFGEGKAPFDFEMLPELLRKNDLGQFFEYSLRDSLLTAKLAGKFSPLIIELSHLISLLPADVSRMTSGQIVEWFLVHESFSSGRIVPNRPGAELAEERNEQRFEGAFVREPERGLHESVAACDFRSLYPSIIISRNIDPDSFGKCACCPGNVSPAGDQFCLQKFGLIPESLKKLVRERAELKKAMRKARPGTPDYVSINAKQAALKLIANSFYGYLGYQNSRWYSFEGARSTAAWGRKYVKDAIDSAEKAGFRIIYGDTDSAFFSSDDKRDFRERVEKFVSEVNRTLPGEMELELQDVYSRGIFLTKKRYAVITGDGRIIIKGLERIRRDWAGIARKTQEEVLLAILRDGSPEKAREMISAAVSALKNRTVSIDDITIYTQLTKKPGQYKLTSPHVEAAKLGKTPARAGMVIRFGIVKGKGLISHRARPIEQVTLENYDADYYIENQLLPAVTRIMDAVGFGEDLFRDQKKLERFF
ncbi:MAG: DNA-directed DNA polymerase [archaeon]